MIKHTQGFVILTVLVLLASISILVMEAIENAQMAWYETRYHWQQLQLHQIHLKGLQSAQEMIHGNTLACEVGNNENVKEKTEAWWQEYGCRGKLGDYQYYYVIQPLYQAKNAQAADIIIKEVTVFAKIGLMQGVVVADFSKENGVVVRLNYLG